MIRIRSTRSNSVLVSEILVIAFVCILYPVGLSLHRLSGGGLLTVIGGALVLEAVTLAMLIRYVIQIFRPDDLEISSQGVKFSSFNKNFEFLWEELEPVRKTVKVSTKGGRSYYAEFLPKNGLKSEEMFLGSFGFDVDEVYRFLISAQSGKLIDPGDAPKQLATVLGWIPLFFSILAYVAWKISLSMLAL
jgi:hypothetical protein